MNVIDCHCGGEPARVVIDGFPNIPGDTMMDKRIYIMNNLDNLRTLLITEPRGYPCQNANILFKTNNINAKMGYVIMEQNKIYPLMSGHNTICVVTAILEENILNYKDLDYKYINENNKNIIQVEFNLEAPGGLVGIKAKLNIKTMKCLAVTLTNVPSFVIKRNLNVKVPYIDNVNVDIVYSGMFYVIVNSEDINLSIEPKNGKEICRIGELIKISTREQYPVVHPEFDYHGPDILVFTAGSTREKNSKTIIYKNTVVMSNNQLDWNDPQTFTGMIDRSPCGTGTCAVMTLKYAKGELKLNEEFHHESIVKTQFMGKIISKCIVGNENVKYNGLVCTITGRAFITQICKVVVNDDDPFPHGFTVKDIW